MERDQEREGVDDTQHCVALRCYNRIFRWFQGPVFAVGLSLFCGCCKCIGTMTGYRAKGSRFSDFVRIVRIVAIMSKLSQGSMLSVYRT